MAQNAPDGVLDGERVVGGGGVVVVGASWVICVWLGVLGEVDGPVQRRITESVSTMLTVRKRFASIVREGR